jgi:hypothetical protein
VSLEQLETLPVVAVEGFEDVRVQQPGLSFYIDRIRARSPYAFVKRTHGFWERLVDLLEMLPDYQWMTPKGRFRQNRTIDRLLRRLPARRLTDIPWDEARECIRYFTLSDEMIEQLESRSRFKNFWRGGFFEDLIRDIRSPCRDVDFFESIAFRGFPGGVRRGRHDQRLLRHAWRVFWTSERSPHDALVWKEAAIIGGFQELLHELNKFSIILVGPDHLSSFGSRVGWADTRHVRIHGTAAIADRDTILDRCRHELERERDRRPEVAVVYQAGSLAAWLIRRLWPDSSDVFHLDVGLVLDAWCPEVVASQRWFRTNREAIIRNLGLERQYERD